MRQSFRKLILSVAVRKKGYNRTGSNADFQRLIPAENHSCQLQSDIKALAKSFDFPCWKQGICDKHPMKAKHFAFHTHIMQTIKSKLAKIFGDKTAKEVLLSGDTIVQIKWTQRTGSGSGASSSSSALPEGDVEQIVKYFTVVALPNLF